MPSTEQSSPISLLEMNEANAHHGPHFSRGERNDLIRIGKRLAKFLHTHSIHRIVFIDQGARTGYVPLLSAWKRLFPSEPPPKISFMNPLGLITVESLEDQVQSGAIKETRLTLLNRKYGQSGNAEDFRLSMATRDLRTVNEEFARVYKSLLSDLSEPVMIFDTCQHTGLASETITSAFKRAGFTQVFFGLASDMNDLTEVRPDFVALGGDAHGQCYPFGKDTLVQKNPHSVVSQQNTSPSERYNGRQLRTAIRQVFDTQAWNTIDPDESVPLRRYSPSDMRQ